MPTDVIFYAKYLLRSGSEDGVGPNVKAMGLAMQIQQIRYFLALCDELSFTRAARRCGVSQPSLTGCIRRLEIEIGGQLFARKPSVSITYLGKAVMPHFRRAARDVEKALLLARALTTDVGGEIPD
jgi:DNA-binding transcriptional LysR family regulator